MKFYTCAYNDYIYFLQRGKVKFMPRGMRWDEAFDADIDASYFPIGIIEGVFKEVK